MLKSLLLLSALIGVNSMPVATNCDDQYYGDQQRQYEHTEDVGNTEVTYKYESNEVNSIDDLVVGNIYHFDFSIDSYVYSSVNRLLLSEFYNLNLIDFNGINEDNSSFAVSNCPYVYVSDSAKYFYFIKGDKNNSLTSCYFNFNDISFDFVYEGYNGGVSDLIPFISYTDFNVIDSVVYIPPTTIFGHLAEVLGDNLYGGIPNLDNVIFTIGGQDITLKSWLVTSTCIVLAGVLITILCLFIRWLFKLFSNTILLR